MYGIIGSFAWGFVAPSGNEVDLICKRGYLEPLVTPVIQLIFC